MAVARQGKSITMTAANDAVTGFFAVEGINFQGTGLTAGQRVRILDTDGSVIADYLTEGTSDNADLWAGRARGYYQGLRIENNTIAGSWVVTFLLG
jgi:hypothetical protein